MPRSVTVDVKIKKFDVEMDVKNNGIEFEVRDTKGTFLGDLVITKTRLIWCEGKTTRANGKTISLEDFRKLMNGRP